MSYVEKKDEEELSKEQTVKSKGLIKTIFSEDTIVENPEDIIDSDPDEERKNAFKKAYEVILALFPETIRKKNKKSKEKEEFDRNLAVREMAKNSEKSKKGKEMTQDEREDKGIERGE